jgi:hypothetical protein
MLLALSGDPAEFTEGGSNVRVVIPEVRLALDRVECQRASARPLGLAVGLIETFRQALIQAGKKVSIDVHGRHDRGVSEADLLDFVGFPLGVSLPPTTNSLRMLDSCGFAPR